MAFKPKKSGGQGPSGRAKVKLSSDNAKMLVWFSPENEDKYADKKYSVTEWPEWVNPKTFNNVGEWNVRMDSKKEKVFSLYPWKGVYRGKVQGFAAGQDKPPTPKTKTSQWGDYQYFVVLLEITDGDAKGAVVPYMLRYNFGADEEGNVMYTNWGPNSVHTPRLDDFLRSSGAWDVAPSEFPFTDNILPKLEKYILHADRTLTFQIKDGWILAESLDSADAPSETAWDADEEDWSEDEPPFETDETPEPEFEESDGFEPVVEDELDWGDE